MGSPPKQSFKWANVLLQASYHLQALGPRERSHENLLFSEHFYEMLTKWEASIFYQQLLRNRKVSACLKFSQAGIIQENWHWKYFHMYPSKPKLLSFTRLLCWRALLPAWVLYVLIYTVGENWAPFWPCLMLSLHPLGHLKDSSWPHAFWQSSVHLLDLCYQARKDNSSSKGSQMEKRWNWDGREIEDKDNRCWTKNIF